MDRGGKKVYKIEITFPEYPPYCRQRYDPLGGVFIVEKCPADVTGLREWGPTQCKRLATVPLRRVGSIMERLVDELYRRGELKFTFKVKVSMTLERKWVELCP